ncbi:hypothetical protein FPHYL_5608 [Fusarium phyllophilum]|uniref:Uncharacterized protein n=1 Tax=Fusarium phyllophilum TaxID=47803 RepID=A0A8H5JWT5_9HYPO|nr:hypothetical protein FPHYL_5608 [Fusarium phyllophilum]
MASSSTLTTITSPTTTLDALTQHDHGKPSHSDKVVIIGLTVGMYLAHRQQKKEQNAEARIRAISAARRNGSARNRLEKRDRGCWEWLLWHTLFTFKAT